MEFQNVYPHMTLNEIFYVFRNRHYVEGRDMIYDYVRFLSDDFDDKLIYKTLEYFLTCTVRFEFIFGNEKKKEHIIF